MDCRVPALRSRPDRRSAHCLIRPRNAVDHRLVDEVPHPDIGAHLRRSEVCRLAIVDRHLVVAVHLHRMVVARYPDGVRLPHAAVHRPNSFRHPAGGLHHQNGGNLRHAGPLLAPGGYRG